MARYDVVLEGRGGARRNCRLHLEADSPGEAVMRARRSMTGSAAPDHVYAVYRRRRVRGRKLVGYFAGGTGGDDDGSAGVREPRRPLPGPSSLSATLDLPLSLRAERYPDSAPE